MSSSPFARSIVRCMASVEASHDSSSSAIELGVAASRDELADAPAQVLLISKHIHVDLDDAIAKKWLVRKRP